ncbi:MAG: hypothetical protein U1F41_12460 [Burkholderiales bacterium]
MHSPSLRRLGRTFLVSLAWACAQGGTPAWGAACKAGYWVSPGGFDGGPGTAAAPFRTLGRARDAVRADARRAQCEIVVNIEGEQRLQETLVLDARDSGAKGAEVVYRGVPGTNASIKGSRRVANWILHDSFLGIWGAPVGPAATRQLYVDGARATRARTRPYPPEYARTPTGYRYVQPGGTPPAWSDPSSVEAFTFAQWKIMSCPVAKQDGADIALEPRCWKNANVFGAPPGQAPLWNFQLLSRFENAYEFLDEPGEWYLDGAGGWLYYIPRADEDMLAASAELPVLETLVDGRGTAAEPVAFIRFEGLAFEYATWLRPGGKDGYVADQSGFHLVGDDHAQNIIGHSSNVSRTPGNVRFVYAHSIVFAGNVFRHLGGVALDFDTGAQDNVVADNVFEDISSAAIQVGGVTAIDHHPPTEAELARDNLISNNLVRFTGRDYQDTAAIYVGHTTRTTVEHNDIEDVPWTGIAIGWGWGLYDPGSFPGLPNAVSGEWGMWLTPTASRGNRIVYNRIVRFLQAVWDGGAIYTQGQQGTSLEDGELIAWNVASGKRAKAGGNTFYTDGGSRYVTVYQNASFDNPMGETDFGPCGLYTSLAACWLVLPYGFDNGGCVPYGDILVTMNYLVAPAFYDPCYREGYPVRLVELGNIAITGRDGVPNWLLDGAGRKPKRAG